MKWMTLEYIMAHSRIIDEDESSLLEFYANSAEQTVLDFCNTTYDALVTTYGEVPAPLYHAALMLVDLSYSARSPISPGNYYMIPYTFDALLKPYIIL